MYKKLMRLFARVSPFKADPQANKVLHCRYSIERRTPRKENMALPKITALVPDFKGGRDQQKDNSSIFLKVVY